MQWNVTRPSLAGLAALGLAACSGGGGSSGPSFDPSETGTLTVRLMDTPVLGATEIRVEIAQVNVKHENDEPIEIELETPVSVDLLALDSLADAEVLLDAEEVAAGRYEWIELVVNAELDAVFDSYVVTSTGQHELQVPSGSVRLVSGFTVTAGANTSFAIDWDARRGLVNPPGLAGYLLRPAFRIIDSFGTLDGRVDPAVFQNADANCAGDDPDLDIGNVVYVFEGTGVTADDIDGNDPDPYATADVTPNADASEYGYETLLAPGDYTVAFTCHADLDDPDSDNDAVQLADIVFVAPDPAASRNVTIVADETVTVDF